MTEDTGSRLPNRPTEALSVELKSWLDPVRPENAWVIVSTLVAMRNHGGGMLLVGYHDDGQPRLDEAPFDVGAAYGSDAIQDLIARHSSERFEVNVTLEDVEGRLRPRINVPAGVRTPVRIKAAVTGTRDGQPHVFLAKGEIPVRTLRSNGRASTSSCQDEDWERVMQTCFDNREADIGRFVRRHLTGMGPAITEFIASIQAQSALVGATERELSKPNIRSSDSLLELGARRFEEAFAARNLPEAASTLKALGGREVALSIWPSSNAFSPTQDFLRRMLTSLPRLTTYPPWLDTAFAGPDDEPQVRQGRWEALLFQSGMFDLLSYEILDPSGNFYERRLLLPDVIARTNNAIPKLVLGERQAITDVSETLITGIAFAAAMGIGDQEHELRWSFRWTGLKGRYVDQWFMIGPSRYVSAEDISPVCRASFPANTAPAALAPTIGQLMEPLFAMFRGYAEPAIQIEETLAEVIERRSKF